MLDDDELAAAPGLRDAKQYYDKVDDAKIIPKPYLGDVVKQASGKTMPGGSASVSVKRGDLPAALKGRGKNFYGVTGGACKIEVNAPNQDLPPKFNSETTLGIEVTLDTIHANYLNMNSD